MSLPLKRFRIALRPFAVLRPSPFSTAQHPLPILSSFKLPHSGINPPLLGRISPTIPYQVRLMILGNKTETTNSELAASDIPDGWLANHDYLKNASEGFPAEDYGLPPAKIILVDRDRSTFLVECAGKYLLWNDISDDVARIDEPHGLSNILQAMKNPGSLKTVRLEMPGAV